MGIKSEKIYTIIENIAKSEDFVEFDHRFSAGSNKGDNYLGEITRVTLEGKKSNGKNGKLNLIIKCAPPINGQDNFQSATIFEREANFYKIIAPKFLEFQKKRGLTDDQIFSTYPKCFYAKCDRKTDEFILIFEDLRDLGYDMLPRDQPSPLENVKMVLRELAKYHAVSIVMKDQDPELFKEFRKIKCLVAEYMESEDMRATMKAIFIRTRDLLDNPVHKEIYDNISKNFLKYYLTSIIDEEPFEKLGVLVHGDCWTNNFMFKMSKVQCDFK